MPPKRTPKPEPEPTPSPRRAANTPILLSPEDRAKIDAIRAHYGLSSLAAAVRFSVHRVHGEIPGGPK